MNKIPGHPAVHEVIMLRAEVKRKDAVLCRVKKILDHLEVVPEYYVELEDKNKSLREEKDGVNGWTKWLYLLIALLFLAFILLGCEGGDICDEKDSVYVTIDGKTQLVEICVEHHYPTDSYEER
jgi:hypothetical protein